MFEATLEDKFKLIFDVSKVRYDQPGESLEQQTLFIEIEKSKSRITDSHIWYKVDGKASLFSPHDKLPFGFFTRKIAEHLDETKDLFFFDIEENSRIYGNIVQRGFSFVYFFNSQYDPALGTITSIETEVTT